MSIIDTVLAVIAPHDCLGCGREGSLLCGGCTTRLKLALPCCYRCRSASVDALTCADCVAASGLSRVQAAAVYADLAKDLVWKLKFAHAQSAARELAQLMSPLVDPRESLLVVPVPTATTRMRQRGYDQACLLARELARLAGQPYSRALARHNQAHQVGASRQQRLQQLSAAFRVAKPRQVSGRDILLVDDVVTTGATLEAATACLRAAGARRITAVVFAQPPASP